MQIPQRSYLICATRRSGSWLLAGGLEDSQRAGHPSEWFNDSEEQIWCERWQLPYPVVTYELYLANVIGAGTAGTGIFGAKIVDQQFDGLERKLRTIPKFAVTATRQEILSAAFPNLKYVFLTRRDKERQAISYYRARYSGVWHDLPGCPLPENVRTPPYDPDEIRRGEEELMACERQWEDYFAAAGVEPLRLVYEDMAARYETTILKVLDYVGVRDADKTLRVSKPRFRKQADATTDEWLRLYRVYKGSKS